MVRLVSSRSAREADRLAESEFGYPEILLMEEAGIRLQDSLDSLKAGEKISGPIVYLTGAGNNGGDGLVMARQAHLRGTAKVLVVSVFPPSSPACQWQHRLAQALGIPILSWPGEKAREALREAGLWVDAVWGSGLDGRLRPERAGVLAELEALRAEWRRPCFAVDVPSGLWAGWAPQEPVLRARWTLSPGWMKDFCFFPSCREACGELLAVPMGFPRPAAGISELVAEADLADLVPRVSPQAYKGTRGHVAVFGGSAGMTGALVLAARSAAAAGAGLVSLGVDASVVSLVAPQVSAFQVRTAEETLDRVSRYDALVAGPGWGAGGRASLFRDLWATDLPLVVDADALGVWASEPRPPRKAPVVLTPHPGEFRRLGAGEPSVDAARSLARSHQAVVVLKGAVTWIVSPEESRVWDGANPALGTGGSGDCLAGAVGALLAQGATGFDAATTAVALHGLAGRDLAGKRGWFTADQLPEALALRAAACMAGPGPV